MDRNLSVTCCNIRCSCGNWYNSGCWCLLRVQHVFEAFEVCTFLGKLSLVDLHYPQLISEKLNLAGSISTTIAVTSIIKFYAALKSHIAQHQPLLKIVAFKLIVGITFFEAVSQKL